MNKSLGITLKFHRHSLIWNTFLLIGGKPFISPLWSKANILTFEHIFDDAGLKHLNVLKDSYPIPGSSYFFSPRLRAALRAYSLSWNTPTEIHPLADLFKSVNVSQGFLFTFYNKLISNAPHPLR